MRSRKVPGITAVLGVAIAAVALWLCLRPDAEGPEAPPAFENIDTSVLPQFNECVRSAESVELFQGFEWHHGKQEMVKKHGWYFYLPPIVPTAADAAALREHVLREAAFKKWRGVKFCGGYHPDWVIQWTSKDGEAHELHLCFGCHEAKIYGPGYQLYCDVPDETFEALHTILKRYHVKRDTSPATAHAMDHFTTTVLILTALILPALIFFACGISLSLSGTFLRALLSIGCGWGFMIAYADAAPYLSRGPIISGEILDFPRFFGWVLPTAVVCCCLLIRWIMLRRKRRKAAAQGDEGSPVSHPERAL